MDSCWPLWVYWLQALVVGGIGGFLYDKWKKHKDKELLFFVWIGKGEDEVNSEMIIVTATDYHKATEFARVKFQKDRKYTFSAKLKAVEKTVLSMEVRKDEVSANL